MDSGLPIYFVVLRLRKAAFFEYGAELRNADFSGGIGTECPADVLGTLGIDGDPLDLLSLNAGNGIEIADSGDSVRAAVEYFLVDTLLAHRSCGLVAAWRRRDI